MGRDTIDKEKILKEIEPLYLRAVNSGEPNWVDVYVNLIAEYILKKCDI